MNAADTNVYVYALDADEPVKQAKALELFDRLVLQAADTVLIWQVAGEFLSQLRRWESKGKLTPEEVEAMFRRFSACSRCELQARACFNFRSLSSRVSACRIGIACYWPPARKRV
jgi:predicted nucleic acid-binding protein